MSVLRCLLVLLCCSTFGNFRASGAFPNAWQISDSSTAIGSTAIYSTNLLAVQSVAATNLGFRYTIHARLVDDFGGSESVGFFYSAGSNRFSVLLDFDSAGNLLAQFPTNGGPNTTLTLTANASTARAFHLHEVLYTPSTKLATYSFDGTPLLTWPGDGTSGAIGQVFWGATSDAGQGLANVRLVQFRINNTNVAIYDAGSSATNRPVPPNPNQRGWIFSGLGTGTATNALSPDNFWQPTVAVLGNNPLVTPWLLPYTDPGAIVTAPPVSLAAGFLHSLALKADGTLSSWGDISTAEISPSATNVIAIASGTAHALAARADGSVVGWGSSAFGVLNIPASATNVVSVAADQDNNIALRADGSIVTWGTNPLIPAVPVSATNVLAIAAGLNHNLVLRSNGTLVAWGAVVGQTNIPATANGVVSIAAGTHNLVARTNGVVVVWGDNTYNQTNLPPSATNVIAVAAGTYHCLALRSNGTIVAWGAGTNNTGVAPRYGQAIVPPQATNIIAIAAGGYHSLALRSDGVVIAWGAGTTTNVSADNFGQSVVPNDLSIINLPVTTNNPVNTALPGNYIVTYLATNSFGAVSVTSRTVVVQFTYPGLDTQPANASNTIATLNGAVNPKGFPTVAWFEWGLGSRFDQKTAPVSVGSGTTPVPISANLSGLTPQLPYRYRLMASNSVNLVARGFDATFGTPVVALKGANPLTNLWGLPFVDPGINATGAVVAVAGGREHSYALKQDGTVVGWGENFSTQTNIPGLANNVIAVSAGQSHGVAARADGLAVAWGDNAFGQATVPLAATNVVAVSAGESYNLALQRDGTLTGWGDDFYSQATAPTFVTNVAAIAAGQRHSLAVLTSGEIVAWGYNGFGQTNVPAGATNIVDIAAGSGHSVALRADGKIFVWGVNSYYQTNLPPTATNVIAIAAGFYHSLALRADGTVIAWGAGTNNTGATPYFGQSIVPTSATNVVAIAAGYYHSFAMRADGSIIAWGAGTTSTGAFPNFGQSIIPSGLNSLNIVPNVVGTVITTAEGFYPLTYFAVNPFGGAGIPVGRNVYVTPAPGPSVLTGFTVLGNGSVQLTFTNSSPTSFTVLASTNISLPTSNWTALGSATTLSPGVYQFTDAQGTNFPQRFYQVRSP